jgi:CHASE1-domain containing sensor protein
LQQASSMRMVHWLIISLSLALTISAWAISQNQLNQKIKNKFEREANQIIFQIKERMELYQNALSGGIALMDVDQDYINSQQ